MAHYAVIDLGSNTFHLLIADFLEGRVIPLFKKRFFTKLSDGGVDYIKPERYQHGLEAIRDFADILKQYDHPTLSVIGTAVMRQAQNRHEFIYEAENILNATIEIIDGHQEADYIYKGVTLLESIKNGNHLIMDIGGGSTEFILVQNGLNVWSQSYSLGVGLLHSLFHFSDPITSEQHLKMIEHIVRSIEDLKSIISQNPIHSLVGASGSFEILQSMTGRAIETLDLDPIEIEELERVFEKMLGKCTDELCKLPGLPCERARLAVTGMTLMKVICDELNVPLIQVSPYALKEGVIREMAEANHWTLEELVAKNKGTIVDVRSYQEYLGGHVVDSVLIPLTELEKKLDHLYSLKKPIIFVCRSGNRSGIAVDKLRQMGMNSLNGGSWTHVNYLKSLSKTNN